MIQLTPSECPLTHDLEPRFNTIKSFTTLDALQTSNFYQKHGLEIERIINGVACRNTLSPPAPPKNIRVVAWNIERGLKIDGILHLLKTNPVLAKADILLITEADIGVQREDLQVFQEDPAMAVHYGLGHPRRTRRIEDVERVTSRH